MQMPRLETSTPPLSASLSMRMVALFFALGASGALELAGADDVAVTADQRDVDASKTMDRRIDLDGIEFDGIPGIGVDVADVGGVDDHGGDIARANLAAPRRIR